MVKTEIFDLQKSKNLTKEDIEKFFEQKKIKPVKWAITGIFENSAKILVSFEGKK